MAILSSITVKVREEGRRLRQKWTKKKKGGINRKTNVAEKRGLRASAWPEGVKKVAEP